MGSEMCIRDRARVFHIKHTPNGIELGKIGAADPDILLSLLDLACLLYTSAAADERSSVDLGGRRILKKKANIERVVRVR